MNRKLLGEQIHGHLQLYRDLGVRYVGRPATARVSPAPVDQGPAAGDRKENYRSIAAEIASGEALETILGDMVNCKKCKLATTRTNLVFGSGNPHAELMFVGEAPGADEDAQGLPFVGRAGRLLTLIIESIGIRREDVYICNILKCRPPQNRDPEIDEIAACEGFLFRQIAAIQPKVIVALGSFGAQTLLRTTESIGKLRGRLTNYRGVKLIATYHPAYLLRSPMEKRKVWEDMRLARNYLRAGKNVHV
ncbi:MAG: uracil-DNA glycosylase [Acidobacteria bacterium]|nr:uracil-DNA glycosylase [Acidobacteriota bacterium]